MAKNLEIDQSSAQSQASHSSAQAANAAMVREDVNVMSLGSHCYTAWLLREMGLRTAAMPFDWLFSDPGMVADIVADDFAALLDPALLVPTKVHGGVQQHAHRLYSPRYGRETVFAHHDPSTAGGSRYLHAAIERFRKVLGADTRKLFVVTAPARRSTPAALSRLSAVTRGRTRDSVILAVRLHPRDPGAAHPVSRVAACDEALEVHDYVPTSEMQAGRAFANRQDNEGIAALIKACLGRIEDRRAAFQA